MNAKQLQKYLTGVVLAVALGVPFAEAKADETVTVPDTAETTVADLPTIIIYDGDETGEEVYSEDGTTTDPGLDDVVVTEPVGTEEPAPVTPPSLDDVVITPPTDNGGTVTPPSLDEVVVEPGTGTQPTTPPSLDDVVVTPPTNGTTTPGTGGDTVTKPEPPTEPTTPTDNPAEPGTENRPTITRPTEDGGVEVVPVPSTTEVNEQGGSQIGAWSEETGQIVSNVSEEDPVETDTGYTIVSTEDSNVVVENADGTQVVVAAEVVGGRVNSDGTISVRTNTGQLETLPRTGEAVNVLSWIGLLMTCFVFQQTKPKLKKMY